MVDSSKKLSGSPPVGRAGRVGQCAGIRSLWRRNPQARSGRGYPSQTRVVTGSRRDLSCVPMGRASLLSRSHLAHGQVDNSDDFGQTRLRLRRLLGSAHPLCRYLPCAPVGRASLLSRSHWAHGRVDNSDDFGQTRFRLRRPLGSAHPLCRYLPCAPMGHAQIRCMA